MYGYTVGGTGYMKGIGNIGGRGYMNRNAMAGAGGSYGGGSAMNALDGYSTGGMNYGGAALDPWTQMYNEAQKANLDRYNTILKQRQKTAAYQNKVARKQVDTQTDEVEANWATQLRNLKAQAVGRGLSASTTDFGKGSDWEHRRTRDVRESRQSWQDKMMEVQNRGLESTAGFQERRTDSYPDLNQMAQLYGAYGAGGGDAGYGGMPQLGGSMYGGMANMSYGVPNFGMPNFYQQSYAYGQGGGNRNAGTSRSQGRPNLNTYDLPNTSDWGVNQNINQLPGTPYSPPTTMTAAMVPGRQNPRNRDYIRRRPTTYGNDALYA